MDKYKKFDLCLRAVGITLNNRNVLKMIYNLVVDIEDDKMKTDEDYIRLLTENEESLVASTSLKIMQKLEEMGVKDPGESAQELAKLFMVKE